MTLSGAFVADIRNSGKLERVAMALTRSALIVEQADWRRARPGLIPPHVSADVPVLVLPKSLFRPQIRRVRCCSKAATLRVFNDVDLVDAPQIS